jgi:hypothetical protein
MPSRLAYRIATSPGEQVLGGDFQARDLAGYDERYLRFLYAQVSDAERRMRIEATEGVNWAGFVFGDSPLELAINFVPIGRGANLLSRVGKAGYEVARRSDNITGAASAQRSAKQIGPAGNPAALRAHDHHVFPQQFKRFFEERGVDIDSHTVTLGERRHLAGVHGHGADGLPGQWNARWRQFIERNPSASAKDVYQFGGRLMDEYGLSGLPIHRYRGSH